MNAGPPIYRSDRNREHFQEQMAEMSRRFGVRLLAYVLMDNHYHLMLELVESNLSRAVQWLNVSYSIWFNLRHRRSGHLFQGRFKSVLVSREEWGLALSRYLHLNPVRVSRLGLGKGQRQAQREGLSARPEMEQVRERLRVLREYGWSSYRAYIGLKPAADWLDCDRVLKLGGGKQSQRAERYRDYVESAVREGLPESPWEGLHEQVLLGGISFVEQVRGAVQGDDRERRGARRLASPRPGLEAVIRSVEQVRQEKWEQFRDRRGDRGRDLVLYLGRRVSGLTLNELARGAGMNHYATVAMAIKRYAACLQKDATEQKRLQRALKVLKFEM
jgi:putative transposase